MYKKTINQIIIQNLTTAQNRTPLVCLYASHVYCIHTFSPYISSSGQFRRQFTILRKIILRARTRLVWTPTQTLANMKLAQHNWFVSSNLRYVCMVKPRVNIIRRKSSMPDIECVFIIIYLYFYVYMDVV